jgi:hypothetical protein
MTHDLVEIVNMCISARLEKVVEDTVAAHASKLISEPRRGIAEREETVKDTQAVSAVRPLHSASSGLPPLVPRKSKSKVNRAISRSSSDSDDSSENNLSRLHNGKNYFKYLIINK